MACCFRFSITELGTKRLIGQFSGVGLELKSIEADNTTVIQCWVPKRRTAAGSGSTKNGSSKPSVVLIHGFGANALWQWPKQLKALSRVFDIYIPNLIFFGESSTTSANRSEVFQAKSLMNVMESLGVHRFHVVGVSYGGFVAFRMAHLFPQAVDKVVIAASGVCMTPEDVDAVCKRAGVEYVSDFLLPTKPEELKRLMQLSFYKHPRYAFECFLRDFIDHLYLEQREKKLELLSGLQLGVKDPTPLPVLTQESLVIWGEHDQVFPLDLAHRVKRHLGDKSRLVILKDASHAVQLEKARQFNEEVVKFLTGAQVVTPVKKRS